MPKCVVNELGTSDYREADTGLSKRGVSGQTSYESGGGGGGGGGGGQEQEMLPKTRSRSRSRRCYINPGAD